MVIRIMMVVKKMVYEKLAQYGPLPIRILAGIAFIIHGLPKLSNIAGTEDFFANMIGLPAAMALPIGLLEVIGGIALLVGALTRVASILLIIEMIGSTIVAKLSRGFVGGYELDLLLMAISISLLLTGPGRISVEWNVLKRELFPKGKQMVLEQLQKR
ncbi:MAG TPA: DoxX family protein [Nitrososphaera sp.]|jgi:putative oxidoreductase|nr:DoxX family protein [Nitrososphaera sp.]